MAAGVRRIIDGMDVARVIGQNEQTLPGPNAEVLEAQARVCTGPHQARPLGGRGDDPRPERVLALIVASLRGELAWDERVSAAQMGAFFAAMTIRRGFQPQTNWSVAEATAIEASWGTLMQELPVELRFLLEPDRGCAAASIAETPVIDALAEILRGRHLSYGVARAAASAVLGGDARPGLVAAFLIGQRMNLETYDELRGHLDALGAQHEIVELSVKALTHFGQPYDGNRRYLHPGVFAAAARAAAGQPSVLHGVDELAPKRGITQEQILAALGAGTDLSVQRAGQLIDDARIGFAYVSQRQYAPAAYRMLELRDHLAKRPSWATAEKALQLFRAAADDHMIIGYYHPGYEERLLQLMWERGFASGVVVKGEEGTCNYSLRRTGKPSTAQRTAINHTRGFTRHQGERVESAADVDPAALGIEYEQSPRPAEVSARSWARDGLRALAGERGPTYDRIVLNAALPAVWTGICGDAADALARARAAIDDGGALQHLERYIRASRQ